LIKRRPSFQTKRRLQYLDKSFHPTLASTSDIEDIISDIEDTNRRKKAVPELEKRLNHVFETNFLGADIFFDKDADNKYCSREKYETLKESFVKAWAKSELGLDLDSEQTKVVSQTGRNLKVTARAGSGKTRTLVARAAFLVQHCKVPKDAVILLAFNKKAASEMRSRLKKFLGDEIPHVMTFHALAYALVHPDERLLVDAPGSESQAQSREIQKIIDLEIRKSSFIDRIRDVMMKYFRGSWNSILENTFDAKKLEQVNFVRSLQYETLNGEYVKSGGEKLIANILFENNIEYVYEKSFKWNGINYRPDFSINLSKTSGVVIEYFGLVGQSEYDLSSSRKREFWKNSPDWKLIERFPEDITRSGEDFEKILISELQSLGVPTRKLSDEEVWRRLKERAIDKFAETMKVFVSRCRKLGLSSQDLALLVSNHGFRSAHEKSFVKIGEEIYASYLELLKTESFEDFDGLLLRAIGLLDSGVTRFARDQGKELGDLSKIKHVLVDEFQDFSLLFYKVLTGIQKNSTDTEYFCVGDDWQAINGFAGSDLTYFWNFQKLFSNSETHHISTNYRSARKIVEIGNALMVDEESSDEISACAHSSFEGQVLITYSDKFYPNTFESTEHQNDEITPLILRVTHGLLKSHKNLTILTRQNKIPYKVNYRNSMDTTNDVLLRFLKHLRQFMSVSDQNRIAISTTHSFKGLESDAIIILDANKNAYPLIHPTWEFFRIFGVDEKTLCNEEQRLFYVALTRAVNSVVIVGESTNLSPFIMRERFLNGVKQLNIEEFPAVITQANTNLEIAVYKSFPIKDQLKSIGFKYDNKRQCWFKLIPASNFSKEYLDSQTWNDNSRLIEVKSSGGEVIYSNF
jgi:DNA helicase-4